jgi:hypothetical protein
MVDIKIMDDIKINLCEKKKREMVEIAIIYYNTPAIYQIFIIALKERNTKLKQVS